jgi:hypothetical protein
MSKLIATLILSLWGVTITIVYFSPPGFFSGLGGHGAGSTSMSAPEIDPSSAVAALTLLLGGVMVLRSRTANR